MSHPQREENKEPLFFLYYLKNKYEYSRFAISVNRKIGNAAERNYIKRKVKELFRLNHQLVNRPHDLWFVIKERFAKTNKSEIETLVLDSLAKIGHQEKHIRN